MIKEIEYLVNEYDIKEIVIMDDQFLIDKERIYKICDLLIQKKIKINFNLQQGASVWMIEFNLLKKMREAGFYILSFPIETGNKNTLKFIRKPIDLVGVNQVIRQANRLGYWTLAHFIIGFPYETKEDIFETIRYAYTSGVDYALFLIAQPFPGSEMHEIYKKEGLLDVTTRDSHYEHSKYNTINLKAKELNKIYNNAVRGFLLHKIIFYLNPINFYAYLLPKLASFEDIRYAIKVVRVLIINRLALFLVGPIRKIFNRYSLTAYE